MKRLEEGFCLWRNPFNGQSVKVLFDKARFFVFWTKNPAPFMKNLKSLDERGLGYYFQYTLNDYKAEGLEPHVPPLKERFESFLRLSDALGPERVVWRFDPIALSSKLDVKTLLRRMDKIASALKGRVERLVVSFIDIESYKSVKARLGQSWREPSDEEVHEIAAGLRELNKSWGLEVKTCAEKASLELYGIEHGACVDRDLILKAMPSDAALAEFLSSAKKDPGQRKDCLCVKSKDIGSYGTCRHGCLYCYAAGRRGASLS